MAFGKRVASDVRDSGGNWVRRFMDGVTQIRILPAEAVNSRGAKVYGTSAWPREREHFDSEMRATFPCLGNSECVGCSHPDKEVSKAKAVTYVFALDEEGTPHIYKMGNQLYKRFKIKEQRLLAKDPSNLQPLSDRDYDVTRDGKGLDTEYDAEAGETYEVDLPDEDELDDLDEILTEEYEDAVRFYSGGEEDEEPEPPRKRARAKKAASRPKPEPKEDENEDEEEEPKPKRKKAAAAKKTAAAEGGLGSEPTMADIEAAGTEDLRTFLTDVGEEFPPRAPRKRLATLAMPYASDSEEIPY